MYREYYMYIHIYRTYTCICSIHISLIIHAFVSAEYMSRTKVCYVYMYICIYMSSLLHIHTYMRIIEVDRLYYIYNMISYRYIHNTHVYTHIHDTEVSSFACTHIYIYDMSYITIILHTM